MIVVATMLLHNYICEHESDDIDFDCVDRDEDYEPTIPERYNKYVVSSDRSTPLSVSMKAMTSTLIVWIVMKIMNPQYQKGTTNM
jgi:hypothetical protein